MKKRFSKSVDALNIKSPTSERKSKQKTSKKVQGKDENYKTNQSKDVNEVLDVDKIITQLLSRNGK